MTTFDSAEATRIMERLRRMAADGDRAVAAFDAVLASAHEWPMTATEHHG